MYVYLWKVNNCTKTLSNIIFQIRLQILFGKIVYLVWYISKSNCLFMPNIFCTSQCYMMKAFSWETQAYFLTPGTMHAYAMYVTFLIEMIWIDILNEIYCLKSDFIKRYNNDIFAMFKKLHIEDNYQHHEAYKVRSYLLHSEHYLYLFPGQSICIQY